MNKWRIYGSVVLLVISLLDTFNPGHVWTYYGGLLVSLVLLIWVIVEVYQFRDRKRHVQ